METIRFDDQVAVVTAAGDGPGRQYALLLRARSTKIVVNDMGGGINGLLANAVQQPGESRRVADIIGGEIQSAGGRELSCAPVQEGERIVQTAIETFGRIHILINNAGILRDTPLRRIKERTRM